MQRIGLSTRGNDEFSQLQFQKDMETNPSQLDMFFIYEANGEDRWYGDAGNQLLVDSAQQEMPVDFLSLGEDSFESDNWRIQELIDSKAWSDVTQLQQARDELHEEVFECHGIELSEARAALKFVCARIRDLSH